MKVKYWLDIHINTQVYRSQVVQDSGTTGAAITFVRVFLSTKKSKAKCCYFFSVTITAHARAKGGISFAKKINPSLESPRASHRRHS